MYRGEHVNRTERPARPPCGAAHAAATAPLIVDGRDVVRDVHEVLDRMSGSLSACAWKLARPHRDASSGRNIGSAAFDLRRWRTRRSAPTRPRPTLRFVSNVDATDLVESLRDLDPSETS